MSDKLVSLESVLKETRRFRGYIDDDMIERFSIAFKRLPSVELPMDDNDCVSRSWLLAEYDRQHEGPAGKARKLIEDAPPRPARDEREGVFARFPPSLPKYGM